MFRSILDDIRFQFSTGNMITRIVIVNLAVFVVVNLINLFGTHLNAGHRPQFYTEMIHYLSVSSDYGEFFLRPWTWVSSVFLHEGFWHILWNMLFLYWFGRIVGDLIGDRRILPIYLLGGLVGAVAFLLSANLLGYGGGQTVYALGASGGVMALVTAAGVLAPEYNMRLLLIGDVKLKWVVAGLIFLDLIGTASNVNTGGHFAHLGGVAIGALYIIRLRDGQDLGAWIDSAVDFITGIFHEKKSGRRPRTKLRVSHRATPGSRATKEGAPPRSADFQEELDRILDKIKASGYESLSEEEREFLYQASNK